jgi:hypothetical protein
MPRKTARSRPPKRRRGIPPHENLYVGTGRWEDLEP